MNPVRKEGRKDGQTDARTHAHTHSRQTADSVYKCSTKAPWDTTFGSCRPFGLFCCVIQYDIHTTDCTDFTHRCLSLIFYGYFTLISLNWNECVAQFVTVWMSSVTTFNPQSLSVPPTKMLKHTKSTQVIRRQCYDPVGVGENVFLELTAALVNAITVNVIKT